MKRPLILYPIFLALFPVLGLFQSNPGMAPLIDLARPLAVTLAAALLLWGVFALLLRNAAKAGLISGLWWLLFFAFGHLHTGLSHLAWKLLAVFQQGYLPLLGCCLGVFIIGAGLLIVTRKPVERLTANLNVITGVLVLIPLAGILRVAAVEAWQERQMTAAFRAQLTSGKGVDAAHAPNIYFLVVDGYAREDMLRDIFKFDNQPFIKFLSRKGFYVARHSRSNYSQTSLSISSMLNMTYLDDLTERMGKTSTDRTPLHLMIGHNAVTAFLKQRGYRTVVYNEYYGTKIPTADIVLQSKKTTGALTEFECALVNLTPLAAFPMSTERFDEMNPYDVHREHIRYALDTLPDTVKLDGPFFVYAHVLCPHPPFVFDERGKHIQPNRPFSYGDGNDFWKNGGTRREYLRQYPQQLSYVNGKLRNVIGALQSRSRRPVVIILLSDHGSGSHLVWYSREKTNLRERLSNFCAVYLPDGPAPQFHDDMTPVNLFPIIFNRYFNANLPLREERSFFSSRHPYDFTDVTEQVK